MAISDATTGAADPAASEQFRALIEGDYAHGSNGSVAFCLDAEPSTVSGRLSGPAGLACALARGDWGVRFLPRSLWKTGIRDSTAVIALTEKFEVAGVPDGMPVIAWVRERPEQWAGRPDLALYDLILSSDADALSALEAVYHGPVEPFAPGEPAAERSAEQLVDLIRAAQGASGPRKTIGFFPDYRKANPYQRLLYRAVERSGIRVVPERLPLTSVVSRDAGGTLNDYLLHVHWTGPILQTARGPFEAARRLGEFTAAVDSLRDRGCHIVWTIHNVLPHECPYRGLEIELCRFLADRADLIHVMGITTREIVAPVYELPASRTRVIPLASYVDVYPDTVRRPAARQRLGLQTHEVVLVVMGGIRPYKGLDVLLDAFDRLADDDPRLRLLIAGDPGRRTDVEGLRARCAAHPRILARFAFIPDDEVQVWYRAADIAVLPYRAVLNSSALQLAIAFGLPVVAPMDGTIVETVDQSYMRMFTPRSAIELESAIRSAVDELRTPEAAAAAIDAAHRYPPEAMAMDFLDLVSELFGPVHSRTNGPRPPDIPSRVE